MKLKKNIAVSENGFLFDSNTGESYSLNKTGQLILKLISEGKSETDIMKVIRSQYDVEAAALQRYLDDFFMILQQMNLLQNEAE